MARVVRPYAGVSGENAADLRRSHRAALEQQEDLPPERPGERGQTKGARMDAERQPEREQGLAPERRADAAAASDRPENEPPHPQDVSEIGETC